jgi:hypothetical protein
MMGRLEKLFPSEIFVAQKTHLEIFPEIAPPPPPPPKRKNFAQKKCCNESEEQEGEEV